MKTISRTEIYQASPEVVFKTIDDLGVTGMYMTKSSMMMMGLKMNFTVEVTQWIEGQEKVRETIGDPKLIIYSWYRMTLKVLPIENGAKAELSIAYEKPMSFFNRIISFLLADWYCRWCLRKMLDDAGKNL